MSAFLLSDKHLGTLANAVLDNDVGGYIALRDRDPARLKIVTLLKAENLKSLQARYGDKEQEVTYDGSFLPSVEPLELLKMLASYNYQSCETDDFYKSEAHSLMEELKANIICNLTEDIDIEFWDVR